MKKYRNKLVILAMICILPTFTGCSTVSAVGGWFAADISDSEVKDVSESLKPNERITKLSNSINTFRKMLEAYNVNQTIVQGKDIINSTADESLPSSVLVLLRTALNNMGDKIIYVPYDPSYVINEKTTGGEINRTLPQVVICGGITEFDSDLISKSRNVSLGALIEEGTFDSQYDYDGTAGYRANSGISRMVLDLNIMEYVTQTSIPKTAVSNRIFLRRTDQNWGIGFYFERCGFSFDSTLALNQGKYYALRLLVELSAINTMGKYFDVPYWRCIPGAQEDTFMVTRLKEEFERLTSDTQKRYLKEYLFLSGYTEVSNENRVKSVSVAEGQLIKKLKENFNLKTNSELFIKLWKNIPLDNARSRNIKYAKYVQNVQIQQYLANQKLLKENNKNKALAKDDKKTDKAHTVVKKDKNEKKLASDKKNQVAMIKQKYFYNPLENIV